MKRIHRSLLIVLMTLLLILPGKAVVFAAEDDISEKTDLIFKEKMSDAGASSLQELVWYFADNAGNGEEWWIISLRQNYPGQLDFSEYRQSYEKYLENTNIASATSRLKAALVLQASGSSSALIDQFTDNSIGQLGIMSYVHGLHALNNGAKSPQFTAESVINTLLDLQLSDGGWAIMGDGGDIDVTGMTVQALSPYYGSNEKVRAAIDRAIDMLAARQQPDGTYVSFGTANPETIAQVVLALCDTGIDLKTDERFIKNGRNLLDILDTFKVSDGGYAHTEGGPKNSSATIQTLYALIGYRMFTEQRGNYHIFGELSEPSAERPAGLSFKNSTDIENQDNTESEAKDLRPLLWIITAAAVVIVCVILLILKKRSYKSYLFVVVLGIVAALGIKFIDIQKPSDYYGKSTQIKDPVKTYLSIRCDTVAGKKDYIPKDGIILDKYEVVIDKGQTAYDQIISAVRKNSIHIDATGGYIAGIAHIYEMDFGDLSGWMFRINGSFSDAVSGEKVLSEGDYVEWLYTTDLGKDIGNEYVVDQ